MLLNNSANKAKVDEDADKVDGDDGAPKTLKIIESEEDDTPSHQKNKQNKQNKKYFRRMDSFMGQRCVKMTRHCHNEKHDIEFHEQCIHNKRRKK